MDDTDAKIAQMFSNLELNGVGACRVKDGEVFAFSKKKILELLDTMDEKNQDKIIVFVKTGSEPKIEFN